MATKTAIKQKKVCPNGHTFFKSSDCPACPFCEQAKRPVDGFLAKLPAPARRALENKGIDSLKKLSQKSKKEILQLHGMGPASLPLLKAALKKEGLVFETEKKNNRAFETGKTHNGLTAKNFTEKLKTYQSDAELKKIQRYFKSGEGEYGYGDQFMGVKMGQLFTLAKSFEGMPVEEIEKLLESPIHELRAGGDQHHGQRKP